LLDGVQLDSKQNRDIRENQSVGIYIAWLRRHRPWVLRDKAKSRQVEGSGRESGGEKPQNCGGRKEGKRANTGNEVTEG